MGSQQLGELFAAGARATPAAIALLCDSDGVGYGISYGALLAAAQTVAASIREENSGLPQHQIVAVWIERSPEAVAAVLGVCMAGAVFLPLERAQPANRVLQLLKLAGAHLALVREGDEEETFAVLGKVPELTVRAVNAVSASDDGSAAVGSLPVAVAVPGGDGADQEQGVAYVMFTSGLASHGRPSLGMPTCCTPLPRWSVFCNRRGEGVSAD